MGRLKPKQQTGRTTARPDGPPPLRAVLAALVTPVMAVLDRPADGRGMTALANMAAIAWNLSRMELRGDAEGTAAVRGVYDKLASSGAEAVMVMEVLLATARGLDPADTRLFTKANMAIRQGELVVEAE